MPLHPRIETALRSADTRTPEARAAIRRLSTSNKAVEAWRALEKATKSEANLTALAHDICTAAATAFPKKSERRTKAEIVQAAQQAEALALSLARLIDGHSSLQFYGEELLFAPECAARYRVSRFIRMFEEMPAELEKWIDTLQRRDFPGVELFSTKKAVQILEIAYGINPDLFAARLRLFAKRAKASKRARPITPHPRSPNAPAQMFALHAAEAIARATGSPKLTVVAGLTSAVFHDSPIGVDLVKKWWKRRGDKMPD